MYGFCGMFFINIKAPHIVGANMMLMLMNWCRRTGGIGAHDVRCTASCSLYVRIFSYHFHKFNFCSIAVLLQRSVVGYIIFVVVAVKLIAILL